VEIIRRMQAQYSDNCSSHNKIYEWITTKREELYAMRDQEGRQCQGLRTVFKPLIEWYGETDE
jgi:hypothetical protein